MEQEELLEISESNTVEEIPTNTRKFFPETWLWNTFTNTRLISKIPMFFLIFYAIIRFLFLLDGFMMYIFLFLLHNYFFAFYAFYYFNYKLFIYSKHLSWHTYFL